MSFGEKIASIMERPGQDPQSKDDVPWWMKYGGRALGTAAGFFAILDGIFNMMMIVFTAVNQFFSGITLIVIGIVLLAVEAPCCFVFLDFVQTFSNIVDKRPHWNRAVLYCGLALVPSFVCANFSLGVLLVCGLIFGTGLIYGMMSVGKKASFVDMRTSAAAADVPTSTSVKGNLVQNAQPLDFTVPIKPDSNV